jgi:hypothetical protein
MHVNVVILHIILLGRIVGVQMREDEEVTKRLSRLLVSTNFVIMNINSVIVHSIFFYYVHYLCYVARYFS